MDDTPFSTRYTNWLDAGYYKAIVTIDGAYDFEVIFLVTVKGEISCKFSQSSGRVTSFVQRTVCVCVLCLTHTRAFLCISLSRTVFPCFGLRHSLSIHALSISSKRISPIIMPSSRDFWRQKHSLLNSPFVANPVAI